MSVVAEPAPRAFETIAARIRADVSAGRFKRGTRLPPERELATRFGVSRNTLREALRALEHAGLLQLRKGASGGAYVRDSDGAAVVGGVRDMVELGSLNAAQLTEARLWIESAVVRAACARATRRDLEALEANVAAAAATRADDFFRAAEIHLGFHKLLAGITRNPLMILMMDAVLEAMREFLDTIGPAKSTWVLPSRRRFLAAFAAGDAEGAVLEMEAHLRRLQRHYLSRVARGG